MNLADVFTVLLILLGVLAHFIAVWLVTRGLWPDRVERAAEVLGQRPLACLLAGLLTLGPGVAAGIAVGRVIPGPAGRLLSAVVLLTVILVSLGGAAGLALRIGRGLPSARDVAEPWRPVLRGGIVLSLVQLTVVLLPVTLVLGAGAWWRSRPAATPRRAA
ncbi:MAG: hypothetical protein ACO3JJ_02800 [Opitutaceae bacterium]